MTLELAQPRLGQLADLGVVRKDCADDRMRALLRPLVEQLGIIPEGLQTPDDGGALSLAYDQRFPIAVTRGLQHEQRSLAYFFVVIEDHGVFVHI